MRSRPGDRASLALAIGATVLATIVVAASLAPVASARGVPPLPIGVGSRFVSALRAPELTAGASGTLSLTLTNPLNVTISSTGLSLEVYAFNGFPGNDTTFGTLDNPPLLAIAGATGTSANFSLGALAPAATTTLSASVLTSSATPIGAYAVRFGLTFTTPNGSRYLLLSRGWFSASLWSAATAGPNGTTVLDAHSLAMLNVSGVLPETSVQVTSSALADALYAILAGAIALAGIGAYLYYRRTGRTSRSGAR